MGLVCERKNYTIQDSECEEKRKSLLAFNSNVPFAIELECPL
jgi:hypothetical protein